MSHDRRCSRAGAALAASLPFLAAAAAVAGLLAPAAAQCAEVVLPGAAGDGFGDRIAAAGDVDGDGVGDVLVFARSYGLNDAYTEVRSGRNSAVLHRIAYDPFVSVRPGLGGAGDLDGDGHGDLLIGEPWYTAPGGPGQPQGAGRVRVLSGADFSVLYDIPGQDFFGYFGYAVASLADVDGDGVRDIAVGEPGNNQNGGLNGAVHIHSGADGTRLRSTYGDLRDRLGASMDVVGDLDQDGFEDLVVGAPYEDGAYIDQGGAWIYSGADLAVLRHVVGYADHDTLGTAVAGVGDWNGDGIPDWAVSAPQAFGTGAVQVISGAGGGNLAWINGGFSGLGFGQVLAAGDVDGDGVRELAIGNPSNAAAGLATGTVLLYGAPWGQQRDAWTGAAAFDSFGAAIAFPGDLDGDGRGELLVGAPGADANGQDSGKLVAFLCGGLQLLPVAPGIAGQPNVLRAVGATPGATVAFHGALQLGSTPLAGCPGVALQLADPLLVGVAVADTNGSAQRTVNVPAAAHGRAFVVQAAEPASCRLSPPRLELLY